MKKEYLKLKKSLLIVSLLFNIPVLTSCNKETTVVENENQNKTDIISSEESFVSDEVITETPVPTVTNNEAPIVSSKPVDNNQEIVNYFNNVDVEIDELLNRIDEAGVKEEIFAKFIKLTDFIFCDGEIKGIKFADLKDSTKQQLKEIQFKIDTKIEGKVPGYKDTLKEQYSQIKIYLENNETLNNFKGNYNELKEEAKDKVDEVVGYENTVDEFWQFVEEDADDVKDMAQNAKEKVKEKYNDWSQKYRK